MKLVEVTDRFYHAICPAFTYYKNGYCYKEPVNEMDVTIFPYYDSEKGMLMWQLSVEHSNFITYNVLERLDVEFMTND